MSVQAGGLPGPLLVVVLHAAALAVLGFAVGSWLAYRAEQADRPLPVWAKPGPLAIGSGLVGALNGVALTLLDSAYRVPPLLGTLLLGVFAGAAAAASINARASRSDLLLGGAAGLVTILLLAAFASLPQRVGPLAAFGAGGAIAGWGTARILRPTVARRGRLARRLGPPFATYGALMAIAWRSAWWYTGWRVWDWLVLALVAMVATVAGAQRVRRSLRPDSDVTPYDRGEVAGYRASYATLDDGSGPLIVILGGLLFTQREWLAVSRSLARKGCGITILDMPWGNSKIGLPSRGAVLPQFKPFFSAVLDLIIQDHQPAPGRPRRKVVLFGYSLGGGFARWVARDATLPIDGVVLLNPAGFDMARLVRIAGKPLVALALRLPGLSALVSLYIRNRIRRLSRDPEYRPDDITQRFGDRRAARIAAVVVPRMLRELFEAGAKGISPAFPTVECYSQRDEWVLETSADRAQRAAGVLVPRPMTHWTHFPHRQVPGEVADFIADAASYVLAKSRPATSAVADGPSAPASDRAEPAVEESEDRVPALRLAGLRRHRWQALAVGAGVAVAAAGVAASRRATRAF